MFVELVEGNRVEVGDRVMWFGWAAIHRSL